MADENEARLDLLRKKAAQDEKLVKKTQETSAGTTQTVGQPLWTPEIGLQLSYSILVFGLIVLVMMSVLVAKHRVNINRLLRAFGLVLIIVAAIFLIVAGYNEQQIAPAMGLLGTIAGYLLGSRPATNQPSADEPDSPDGGKKGPKAEESADPGADIDQGKAAADGAVVA